jgi:hypothetical protein
MRDPGPISQANVRARPVTAMVVNPATPIILRFWRQSMGGRKRTIVRASKVNDPEFLENQVILHKII